MSIRVYDSRQENKYIPVHNTLPKQSTYLHVYSFNFSKLIRHITINICYALRNI